MSISMPRASLMDIARKIPNEIYATKFMDFKVKYPSMSEFVNLALRDYQENMLVRIDELVHGPPLLEPKDYKILILFILEMYGNLATVRKERDEVTNITYQRGNHGWLAFYMTKARIKAACLPPETPVGVYGVPFDMRIVISLRNKDLCQRDLFNCKYGIDSRPIWLMDINGDTITPQSLDGLTIDWYSGHYASLREVVMQLIKRERKIATKSEDGSVIFSSPFAMARISLDNVKATHYLPIPNAIYPTTWLCLEPSYDLLDPIVHELLNKEAESRPLESTNSYKKEITTPKVLEPSVDEIIEPKIDTSVAPKIDTSVTPEVADLLKDLAL